MVPQASMVESVDTPDLKSVEHRARGSSSLLTRTKNKYKIREQALCLIKLLKHTVGITMAV